MRLSLRALIPSSRASSADPESRLRSSQNIEALFESVSLERFFPFLVVVGIVRVEPVAAAIDMEIGDFGEVRGLQQKLLFRNQLGDEIYFRVVQMKLAAI